MFQFDCWDFDWYDKWLTNVVAVPVALLLLVFLRYLKQRGKRNFMLSVCLCASLPLSLGPDRPAAVYVLFLEYDV